MPFLFDRIPKYLTLQEGAEFISQLLGHHCSVRNLLTMAEFRQFGLFAGVDEKPPFVSVTRIKHPSPSTEDFYMFPLTESNIQELMACGYTLITKIPVYSAGKDFGKESTGWEIAPGHMPPRVTLEECRVSRDHLKRWVEVNRLDPDRQEDNSRIATILSALLENGFDKDAVRRGGKKAAKAHCIKHNLLTDSTFEAAWKKASKAGLVRHELKEKCQPRG
jgi:hypothetical protein